MTEERATYGDRPASDTPRTDEALRATMDIAGRLGVLAERAALTDLARQLERELATAMKDAKRYRWLRSEHADRFRADVQMWEVRSGADLDAAIDYAARTVRPMADLEEKMAAIKK